MSLYNKYRPTTLSQVVGQEHIKAVIKASSVNDVFNHAYLLIGSRGIGKTSIARIIAKLVNCLSPKDGEPCNKCENCLLIMSGKTPDIIEFDAASNRGVSDIDAMLDAINYAPVSLKKTVYIIDEIHQLSSTAKDSLLKTLEEPPGSVMFILATTEGKRVPPTIRSRCQFLEFRKASVPELIKLLSAICKLEKIACTEAGLSTIATYANGSYRDALTILETVSVVGDVDEDTVCKVTGVPEERLVKSAVLAMSKKDVSDLIKVSAEVKSSAVVVDKFIEALVLYLFVIIGKLSAGNSSDPRLDKLLSTALYVANVRKDLDYNIDSLALDIVLFGAHKIMQSSGE
jgi:DNA polymerase-3 subunit gamma/tau